MGSLSAGRWRPVSKAAFIISVISVIVVARLNGQWTIGLLGSGLLDYRAMDYWGGGGGVSRLPVQMSAARGTEDTAWCLSATGWPEDGN